MLTSVSLDTAKVGKLQFVFLDIDECTLNEDDCSEFATCSDIVGGEGSFQCTCNTGYSGDGTACNSK